MEGNENTPAWMAQVTDDLRGNETLTGFQTIGDLAGAYLEKDGKLSEVLGELETAVRIPGEDASDDDWAALFTKLGRPESPDEYEVKRPELPEGIPYDEEGEAQFKGLMHELGLTKGQAEKLFAAHGEHMTAVLGQLQEQRVQAHNEAIASLQKEWGGEEAFTENVKLAIRAAEQFGGPELADFLDRSGLGDNPVLIKTFHRIAEAMADDTFLPGYGGGVGKTTPEVLYPEMQKE